MTPDNQKFSVSGGCDGMLSPLNQEQHCHVPQETTNVAAFRGEKSCSLSNVGIMFPRRKRSGLLSKKPKVTAPAVATAVCASPECKREPSHNDNPNAEHFCRNNIYTALIGLKAIPPQFVLKKALTMSDLKRGQNRLQIKRSDYNDRFLHQRLLTADEHQQVLDGGLVARSLDWKGNRYKLLLRYLDRSGTYRIRAGWGRFLQTHDLDEKNVGDIVELWAFRSPKWRHQLGFVLFHHGKDGNAERGVATTADGGNVVTGYGEAAIGDNVMTCSEVHAVMVLMSLQYET